jgi:hypothetical protein
MVNGTVLALLTLVAPARSAAAEDPRAVEARRHCAAGRVEPGIELLARIVAETGDPNAVYNQARCYQQNGRAEEALARFQEYRRIAPALPAGERAQVDAHIRDLEAALRARAVPAAPPVVVTPAPAVALAPPAPAPPVRRSRSTRLAAGALAAAGVLGVAGGAVFGLQAQKIESEIEHQQGIVPSTLHEDRMKRGLRYQTLQWVSYGVGAAALAGAAVVLIATRPHAAETTAVAVLPRPDGATVNLQGRF